MKKQSSYTAIIVDDERSSRLSLSMFLKEYCGHITILGQAENILEAQKLIKEYEPQIVFLDIEMPHGNAFDLISKYRDLPFHVIFVTAYSQYALKALKLSAAQYLVKPVDIEELESAVERVTALIDKTEHWAHTEMLLKSLNTGRIDKIVIPLINGFELIPIKDVVYIKADDNYCHVHLNSSKTIMACRKLKFYEEALADSGFYRIHRSTMINLDYVQRYTKGKLASVTLTNGINLDISQSRKKGFLKKFSI